MGASVRLQRSGKRWERRRAELINQVRRHGYNARRIAEATGESIHTIRAQLKWWDVKLRPLFRYHSDRELREVVYRHGNLRDAAKELGVHFTSLGVVMRRRGIEHRQPWGHGKTKLRGVPDEVLMSASLRELVRRLGVTQQTIIRERRRRGLPSPGKNDRKLASVSNVELLGERVQTLATRYAVDHKTVRRERKRRQA